MFPQSLRDNNGLEQMLHQLPYAPPMPLPAPIMDRSITSARWKPNIELAPNCPRCASTNTKFCYYNNYSLSQPRYFCKGCRRYWTKGGSLRNVPVGGGCRKSRPGRAARHSHQSERPSMMNNNTNGNSGPDDRDSLACDGDQASSEANGSRDIDMALVFAKFLNPTPSSGEDHGSSSSNNLSTSLTTPESAETENDAVVQPQKGCDPVIVADSDADAMGMGLLCGVPLEGTIESFRGEELSLSGIELEGFDVGVMGADEDVVQDVVWSHNDDAIMWQPPPPPPMMQMQLQEMEYSMAPLNEDVHELLPISSSMNLVSDGLSTSWSSFDLSTMEVFSSRP